MAGQQPPDLYYCCPISPSIPDYTIPPPPPTTTTTIISTISSTTISTILVTKKDTG